jgi:hypothetical protein
MSCSSEHLEFCRHQLEETWCEKLPKSDPGFTIDHHLFTQLLNWDREESGTLVDGRVDLRYSLIGEDFENVLE